MSINLQPSLVLCVVDEIPWDRPEFELFYKIPSVCRRWSLGLIWGDFPVLFVSWFVSAVSGLR